MHELTKYEYNVNKNIIEENGKFVAYMNCVDGVRVANKLNVLQEENEELKQREETLLSEIEDFQELLAKNDCVCHKRIIDLIDDYSLFFFILLQNGSHNRVCQIQNIYILIMIKLSFAIQNLRELKKELSE